MNILIFILSGLLLALLFRLLRRIIMVWVPERKLRAGSKRALPAMELLAWIIYAFWGVHVLFRDHVFFDMIIGVMALFLVGALAWFVFRDFLAGVIIRAEKSLEPGQAMRTSSVSGKISKLGSLSLELINDDGEVVRIPYAKLNQDLITLPPLQDDNLPHHVELDVPPGVSSVEMQKRITSVLHTMPWIITPEPVVQVAKRDDGRVMLHVTYYTHMRSQAQFVEEKLGEALMGGSKAPGSP